MSKILKSVTLGLAILVANNAFAAHYPGFGTNSIGATPPTMTVEQGETLNLPRTAGEDMQQLWSGGFNGGVPVNTLPAGITFDTATSVITVAPSTALGNYELVYFVRIGGTNFDGNYFNLNVLAAGSVYEIDDITLHANQVISPAISLPTHPQAVEYELFTLLTNGNRALRITGDDTSSAIAPIVFRGATDNPRLDGTAPSTAQTFNLELVVASGPTTGAARADFDIIVVPGINIPNSPFAGVVGTAFTDIVLPEHSGTDEYRLSTGSETDIDGDSTAIPGLNFNKTTRTLSGTPTAAGDHRLVFTALNAAGDTLAQGSFEINIVGPWSQDDVSVTIPRTGEPDVNITLAQHPAQISMDPPAGTGYALALDGNDVNGADDTSDTEFTGGYLHRTFGIDSNSNPSTYTATYTSTNPDQSITFQVELTQTQVADLDIPNSPFSGTALTAISNIVLPESTVAGIDEHRLSTGSSTDIDGAITEIPGLTYDKDNRTISGTPTVAAVGDYNLTLTALNSFGNALALGTLAINIAQAAWEQADIAVTIPLPGTARADNIFSDPLPAAPGATGSTTYDLVITSNPVHTALNGRSVNAPGGSASTFDGLNFGDGEGGRMDDRRIEVHQGAIPGVYAMSYSSTSPDLTTTFNLTLVPQAWEQDDVMVTLPLSLIHI